MPWHLTSQDAATKDELLALLPRLRRYARVLTGTIERADALVQATLQSATKRNVLRQQAATLRARLLAIMHEVHENESSHPPSQLPWTPSSADENTTDGWQTPDDRVNAGRTELVETFGNFSRLPVEQREVLMLVAVEGLSYSEIAGVLRVPIATVMARLKNARQSMHSMAVEGPSHGKLAD